MEDEFEKFNYFSNKFMPSERNKNKMTYEGLRLFIRKHYINATFKKRRKKIKNCDFTIISNNCWGGLIYQSYGLQYNTPTVGLFFMANDYIKFISNLKEYMKKELIFIKPEDSHSYEDIKNKSNFGTYPIGCLGDVEIHFLHYKTEQEASEKWNRRKERINFKRILYKFNDQNACTKELLEKFSKLPLKNKICFTSKQYNLENTIYIKNSRKYSEIKASYEPFGKSRYVNMNEIINNLVCEE